MTQPVRFDNVEMRPAERRLLVEGRPVAIGARAFDVLNMLVMHRDRTVGKDELLTGVWPGVVVEENNLQVQISALRKILGTSAISTIAGFGYQFTATVDSKSASLPQSTGQDLRPQRLAPEPKSRSSRIDRAESLSFRTARQRIALAIALGGLVIAGCGFWLSSKGRPLSSSIASDVFKAPPHSVAVLPFANMSRESGQDYFSDGLSEELLDSLSSIPDLRVAARSSSFTFKDKNVRIVDIGRDLGVGAVLEGSVRKDGQHVRVSVQLVDAITGYDLWSHSYDREITNILVDQAEIAATVTKALQAKLLPNAAAAVKLTGTQNLQPFDAYLKGETLECRIDEQAVLTRIAALEEAIRRDQNFTKTYVPKGSRT